MAGIYGDWESLGRDIVDLVDRAVSSQDFKKLNQSIRRTVEKAVGVAQPPRQTVVEEAKKAPPVLYGTTGGITARGVVKIVGGSFLLAMMLPISLKPQLTAMVIGIAGFAGGVGLICGGINTLGRVGRFKAYRKVLGEKTHRTLEALARSVGKNVSFVRREVRRMIDLGLFREGHLDKEQTRLITSHETYRLFEQSRIQLEQRQARQKQEVKTEPKPVSPVQEVLDRGNAFIREIRRCNDAIPGHEVSAKIDRMETLVRRIFQRAEADPEVVPDLKKLMDYYLPMTVKLLNAYAEMDAQPVQGETILHAKKEIEETLDTLNLAFEKLLDELFADTALDISSDISVLNTMLAQEGLAEDELTKMKKNKAKENGYDL